MNTSKKSRLIAAGKHREFRIAGKRIEKCGTGNLPLAETAVASLHPDALKKWVRDTLAALTTPDRGDFIQSLDRELRRCRLNVRAYLVPLGIPAQNPEELTPTEIGHLIRYLKMVVPQAMPAVERVVSAYVRFAEERLSSEERPAA